MLPSEIKTHRDVITLKDGGRVLLRSMVPEDYQGLLDFYAHTSDDDMRFMRHNVKDPAIVKNWCDNLDYNKILPILALVKDQVVGSATLHFSTGPKRHVAEVRLFLARDFRQRGLGMKMTRAIIDLARKQNIRLLTAEVIAEKTKVVRAFETMGFITKCVIPDYFMFPDGDTCDVAFLMLDLKPKGDDF
jgi:L-amino acid N-acyltransferase YncA